MTFVPDNFNVHIDTNKTSLTDELWEGQLVWYFFGNKARGLIYKTFYSRNFTDFHDKLECLSLASLSSLV